jgi:hypothetical protein
MMAQGLKPHLKQLPPLLETHSRLEDHSLCQWFKDAELEHLESHYKMKSWLEVPAKKIKAAGHQILSCMWVYTYKLDKKHHLLKCKARLVVRGDQQRNVTSEDTYAATLASKFKADQAIEHLQGKYTITGGHDLQWFLGIEITRDQDQRKIFLSQTSYIDKISQLVDRKDLRHNTPMGSNELMPYEGIATPSTINRYQRKIGSLLFAAVTTRPDVAFATSRLARFLTNPGQQHHDAVDWVLLYLQSTRRCSLRLRGGHYLEVASDASFADNTLDRKSSQGYTIKLYGGLIAWRANKQDTVTTSTTEAELLALSQVAKEAIFTSRLLSELGIKLPDSTITIQCDNTQTIQLINKEVSKLQTKLRHVDIHNHWLRQEATKGTIAVTYMPSAEMLADRLTKALPSNK